MKSTSLNSTAIKQKNLRLDPGKSEFHRFIISGKPLNPCICDYNLDFGPGCVSNVNPYFSSGKEIISKNILKRKREVVLRRFDERQKIILKGLDKRLNPDVIWSRNFSEELKEFIWEQIHKQVEAYQEGSSRPRSVEILDSFTIPELGLVDGRLNGCSYCYAGYQNNKRKILAETVNYSGLVAQIEEITEQKKWKTDSNGNQKPIVRFGKRVEIASLPQLNILLNVLEIFHKYRVASHLPTKHLPFDERIAYLLKQTDSVLAYSIGYEKQEVGPLFHGLTTKERLRRAKKYADYGVNVMLKMVLDCTVSLKECERHGAKITEIKQFLRKNPKIKRQLIPIRIHKKEDAVSITSHTKSSLLGNANLFGESVPLGRYSEDGRHVVFCDQLHPEFRKFFSRKDGSLDACANIGRIFYCDSCQFSNMPYWTLENKYVQPVELMKKAERDWKLSKEARHDSRQGVLPLSQDK